MTRIRTCARPLWAHLRPAWLGGVSEPSLYGIHLRYKLIYKRMLVGCGLGGVVIAILGWLFPSVTAAGQTVHGVTTTAFAFTSLLTIPVFNQMWVYAVSIAVSFLTSFLLIITFDYRTPEQKAEVLARAAANQKTAVSSVEAQGSRSGCCHRDYHCCRHQD